MKSILVLLIVALITVNGQTLCDKYATALKVSGYALVETVVNGTIGAVLNSTYKIDGYFNGKNGGTDFTAASNSALLVNLRKNLVEFFADPTALNCTDKSTMPYSGATMKAAHATLKIDFYAFYTFNNLLLGVMTGAGVTTDDATAVAGVLNSLRADVCTMTDCTSICNKLIVPGVSTSKAVVSSVVNATVIAALGNADLKPYFTGVTGGRPDFTATANAGLFTTLFDHLVKFFGMALGCTDGSIGAYDGATLKAAHANMNVTLKAFDTFNAAVIGVLKGAGMVQADLDAVYGVLNGTKSDVCTASDCGVAPTTGGSTSGGSTSGGSTSGGSTTSSAATTPAPTPAPSTTGFGLVLAPVFALFSLFFL